jgi:hypothetical protein
MSLSFHLVEGAKIVEGLPPAADAAGRAGDYVSLKDAARIFVVAHITQGNAATVALTLFQATAVAGTGEKAITNAVPIWSNLDTAATDTLVPRTPAVSYTTDAAVKNKVVVFQIDAASLDTNGGFDCFCAKTGASNAANITEIMYYLVGHRYGQVTPPAAITD